VSPGAGNCRGSEALRTQPSSWGLRGTAGAVRILTGNRGRAGAVVVGVPRNGGRSQDPYCNRGRATVLAGASRRGTASAPLRGAPGAVRILTGKRVASRYSQRSGAQPSRARRVASRRGAVQPALRSAPLRSAPRNAGRSKDPYWQARRVAVQPALRSAPLRGTPGAVRILTGKRVASRYSQRSGAQPSRARRVASRYSQRSAPRNAGRSKDPYWQSAPRSGWS
jgi:hypothetical protein